MIRSFLAVLFASRRGRRADAERALLSNADSGTISVDDTGPDEMVATVALGGGVPNRIVLTPDGTQALAVHDESR